MAIKVTILVILAICIALAFVVAASFALAWIRHLWDADRQVVRDERRAARWAEEDLKDALSRQNRRKK